MKIGTRSLLFGVHQVFIHPWFVAVAWWRLYGFPWDPRLWVAFLVHDWGYWGKSNMDGPEGERHPELGADIMRRLFDRPGGGFEGLSWYGLMLFHSRFYAKSIPTRPSKLCFADKLSFALTPNWLYIPLARLSGEIQEYRQGQAGRTAAVNLENDWEWHDRVEAYIRSWIRTHIDGREDTWTEFHGLTERDEALVESASH